MWNWRRHASVHTTPRRVLGEAESGLYYSRRLTPMVGHPLVEALGSERRRQLLVQQLYAHLEFTAHLEHRVVMPIAWEIGRGRLFPWLESGDRLDANKIYVDEAYHSMAVVDFAQQVRSSSGVTPRLSAEPAFLARLAAVAERAPEPLRAHVRPLFVVISETLITDTLRELHSDPEVLEGVRGVVRDHARDEAVHRAYFTALFRRWWPRLPAAEQQALGVLLPSLIDCYFTTDVPQLRAWLREAGLSESRIAPVIEQCTGDEAQARMRATATTSTRRLFDDLGVLEHAPVREAFERHGLSARADPRSPPWT